MRCVCGFGRGRDARALWRASRTYLPAWLAVTTLIRSVVAGSRVRVLCSVQAFDTATHALLVRDMVRWDEDSAATKLWLYRKLLIVFVVWAMHAVANVVSVIFLSWPEGRVDSNGAFIVGADVR